MSNDLMKQFVSLCRDGASPSIGCENSLYTQLKKDYPNIVFLWNLSPSGCVNQRFSRDGAVGWYKGMSKEIVI